MDEKTLTDQMKYGVVAAAIASFQSELEKQYFEKGIRWTSPLAGIVQRFAENMMYAYKLFPDDSETKTNTL